MRIIIPLLLVFILTVDLRIAAQLSRPWPLSPDAGENSHRQLIICLDGVGYSEIVRLKNEGRFKYFDLPSRMVSPFPSLTNLSIAKILEPAGAAEPEGYEDHYYDSTAARIKGGLIERFQQDRFIKGTFRQLFDYHPSAFKSGLGYVAPPLSTYIEALTDIVQMRREFESSKNPVFFAYIGSTDSLAHLGGRSMLRNVLKRLDREVSSLIEKNPGHVSVSIFSDHGNEFRKYKRVALKRPLENAGFRLVGRVKGPRDVVLPQYGLIGSAVLFTSPEVKEELAMKLASVRGIDLAVVQCGSDVRVFNRNGNALIEKRGARFKYTTVSGDPLALLAIVDTLETAGRVDSDGFISDDDWFRATAELSRPDVIKRVYDGATGLVKNLAQVLVSFEDGYYTGSFGLDLFSFLQATHGSLGQEQSYGFALSTQSGLPKIIRAADLWAALGTPVLKKGLRSCLNCGIGMSGTPEH